MIVIHGHEHPTIASFLEWAYALPGKVLRVSCYKSAQGVRGSVLLEDIPPAPMLR